MLPMDGERLVSAIAEQATAVQRGQGVVEFVFDDVRMLCIYDTHYDRMRIVTPVAREHAITPEHLSAALIANFHSALDARYAMAEGIVYAAYLHPLSSLSRAELVSALRQVSALAKTFGTTFSSGELYFPGSLRPPAAASPPTDA